ncbi:SNF2 family N-terminal domain-containing protein [Daldinia eschscholtzii]|nr:SNF2 family N-terminal domain-containing protein [Daldinia eschscholtzii]
MVLREFGDMSNMLEDSDSTYMEPLTPGVKRPWEAVSQWGEYGNDSTTPLIYPHKKTWTDQELDISNDSHTLEFGKPVLVERVLSKPSIRSNILPPPWDVVGQRSGWQTTGNTGWPYQSVTEYTYGNHYTGIEENIVSSQYISSHSADNNIKRETYKLNCFWDKRPTLPNNETQNNAYSTARSSMPCSIIPDDTAAIVESSGKCSYDTCFGVIIIEDIQLKAGLDKGIEAKDVKFEVNGTMVIILDEDSGSYRGLLGQISARVLVNLLTSYKIELKASLKTSEIIEVLIYGQFEHGDAIGNMLLEHDCFLQQPDSYDVLRPYKNPQCLLYSDKEEDVIQTHLPTPPSRYTVLDEGGKSKATELLDCAVGPANFKRVQAPRVITTELKSYQSKALAMMMEKESGNIRNAEFPSVWVENINAASPFSRFYNTVTQRHHSQRPKLCLGGLLADEMGLGKTLTALALIATSLNNENHSGNIQGPRINLIVCPLSIPAITSWQDQVEKHFEKGSLTYSIYHGLARGKTAANLKSVDIVFTTYETLRAEVSGGDSSMRRSSLLHGIEWHRVILDEAHVVRNRASKTFQAARMLKAKHRWCLTGTPIQNRLEDLGSLVEFLRIHPFDDPDVFKHTFLTPIDQGQQSGWDQLKSLIQSIALRRTKESVNSDLCLPSRKDFIHHVRLNSEEQTLYNLVKRGFALAIESGGAVMNTFQFILRLRQICNHGSDLLPGDLRDWLRDATYSQSQRCELCNISLDHEDESSYHVFPCFHQVCRACLQSSITYDSGLSTCSLCNDTTFEEDENMEQTSSKAQPLNYSPSSKVKALLQNLRNDHTAAIASSQLPAKSIIFSAWTGMLDLIGRALSENSFTYQRLDGSKSLAQRRLALEEFRTNHNCIILLASLGSAAVGLDLTMASRVHLMEPGWNPLIEQQAMDRVYRLGQENEVITTRYIVSSPDSIEQYIQRRQSWKMNLIASSLDDSKTSRDEARAILQDLKCTILSNDN